MVADVSGTACEKVLFGQEIPVAFAIAWKASADGTLSEEIRTKGLEALRQLLAVCDSHGVPANARRAVATEVFRKAANGADYLAQVHRELGLAVEVVTQDVEADLGFRTAVALQGRAPEDVVCWDSGGASFQITSLEGAGQPLRSYLGALGTGVCAAMLVEEVQGGSFSECSSPNPVAKAHAEALVAAMRERLAEPADWLRGKRLTAIGGPNSMFCVTSEALGTSTYALGDVRRALSSVLDLADADMAPKPYCQGELREPAAYIVPKIALLVAVMEHCEIAEVHFCASIGSCAGLLISEERYKE